MQYKWLNNQGNKNLIVFFNGWGMDDKIVSNLNCDNYDVLTYYDYRTFEPQDIDFSKYENKYLIAWSMGVYVCNIFYDLIKDFNKKIAINGTQKPIDDKYGIPIFAYNLTIDNFNETTCKKFMKKISSTVNLQDYCSRNLDELKQELISIKNLEIENYIKFDKVIISQNDRIFPYQNMLNFWNEQSIVIENIEASHYIFNKYNNWSDLI